MLETLTLKVKNARGAKKARNGKAKAWERFAYLS